MSLISDPDFLIHSIRLNYLRNIDDPYGRRLISLDPSYHSNPYVLDAGLADVERWPELSMPTSPPPSDDESNDRPSGFPGARGLKYTTTIMGPSRAGAIGLRVSGKRGHAASSSRSSIRSALRGEKKLEAGVRQDDPIKVETIPATPSSHSPKRSEAVSSQAMEKPDEHFTNEHAADSTATPTMSQEENKSAPATSKNIPVPFVPKFKGAAEMEARRKLRMMNRVPPGGAVPPRPTKSAPANLNPEILSSSSESESEDEKEEDALAEEEDDFDDDAPDVDDSLDIIDADEFDPEFAAASRDTGLGIDSQSDGASSLLSGSGSGLSASNFSTSSLPRSAARNRSRLSPVHENRHSDEIQKGAEASAEDTDEEDADAPSNSFFSMVTPAPLNSEHKQVPTAISSSAVKPVPYRTTTTGFDDPAEAGMFTRLPVPPAASGKSTLSAMLASTSGSSSSNPFSELYSAISGRSESESMTVQVYFPHAKDLSNRAMELSVRKDATMEEVLGFALWSYWEEGWLPKLDEGLEDEEDPKWATRCSALGWILRIAEEDGEVDEDFPPPDRTGRVSKFNFDAYAVLEASAAQVMQNKILDSKIQRRPSRIVVKKKKSAGLLNAMVTTQPAETLLGSASAGMTSLLGSSVGMFPSSLGPSSQGPPMFLRIRIADTADAGHVSTTIQTSGGMYMAEVLEAVCQKRKLTGPKDYALVVDIGGVKILIPLDRTVRSLQGKRDLMLIKKHMLQQYGVEVNKREGRTTDPNASIFKRNSELPGPEQIYSSVFDYTSAYKRYTIYRKVPMLVTRSARLLAIDGGYIHIMPQANKAKNVFDNGKTASYDIKSIVACQQSSKNSTTFKLVVHRGDTERNKRYEFEAESPKLAAEIVQTIRSLKSSLDRPGTANKSRRSRHVS